MLQQKRSLWTIIFGLGVAACGPGRQAAWEKEAEGKVQQAQATPAEAAPVDHVAEGEAAFLKRVDRAELEKAISHWEQHLAAKADDGVAMAKLARAHYLLGDGYMRLAGEDERMLTTLEKGVEYGERAMMAISPKFAERVKAGEKVEAAIESLGVEGIDAVYWYAACLGKFAEKKGFTTVLFYKDRIYAVMQRVLQLNPDYFFAAPHRYFGAFYAKAPSFAGGDMAKSKEHFDKAISMQPAYFGTKVLYAEFYGIKQDDKELFTKLLTEVKEADPAAVPEIEAENRIEQAKAVKLLANTNEYF